MEALIRFLKTINPTLTIGAFALETFDANTTGLDDDAAAALKKAVDIINKFLLETDSGTAVKGLAGIRAYGENVIASLTELETNTTRTKEERRTQAELLVDSLSDPAKVTQAQRGLDAEELKNYKFRARKILERIKAQPE